MNNKGLVQQFLMVLILFLALASIISLIWIGSIVLPILTGEGKNVATTIQSSLNANSPGSSITNSSAVATNMTINSLNVLPFISYFGMIVLLVGFIVVCFYVREYQWLAVFWPIICLVIVIFSFILSNAYQTAASSNLSSYYTSSWSSTNLIMNYLPIISMVFGIISGIILFGVLSTKEEDIYSGGGLS